MYAVQTRHLVRTPTSGGSLDERADTADASGENVRVTSFTTGWRATPRDAAVRKTAPFPRRYRLGVGAALTACALGSAGLVAAPVAAADDLPPEAVTTSAERPGSPKRGFIRVDVALWRTVGAPYTVVATYTCRRGTCRETLSTGPVSDAPRVMRLRNIKPTRGEATITLTFIADPDAGAFADVYPKIGDCGVQQTPGGRNYTRIICTVSTRDRIVLTDDLCSRERGPAVMGVARVC